MAIRPISKTLTNSSVDILNAIRNSATVNYREYVPVATKNPEVIRKIGAVLMDYPNLMNEFLGTLVGRIGKVRVSSKLYENPLKMFKKGLMELGESIEDIFVELAKPHTFDPEASVSNMYAREIPDVRSTFYVLNYQKFYKQTISRAELRTAFVDISGVTNLITKIVTAMYTGANYDEFQVMKYMLAVRITEGLLYPVETESISAQNAKAIVTDFKAYSNDLEFLKTNYNLAGVHTNTLKNDQYLIINSKFDAMIDVEVLASAFNMNKAEFMGHRILIDGFGQLDTDRLGELFDGDSTYTEFDSDDLTALDAIPAVIVDKEFFQIYDNLMETDEEYNKEGLYWNYWLHKWTIFGVSPFANALLFVPDTPAVTAISVSPETATVGKGESVQLTATVTASNYAPKTVEWTSSNEAVATVDARGIVTVKSTATTSATATITATSTWTGTVTDTAVITVGS